MREGYASDLIYRYEIFKKNSRVLAITVVGVNNSCPPPPPPPKQYNILLVLKWEFLCQESSYIVLALFSLMHLIYVFGFFNVFVYPFFPRKATVTGFQKLVFSETKHWTRKRTIKPSLSYFFIHLSISIKFILKVPLLVLPQLFL